MQGEALVRGVFEDMLKLDSMYCSPTVMPRLIAKYDSYNISLPPEQVQGIHVLNEGNRIEFLLASFYRVLNGGQYNGHLSVMSSKQ